MRSISKLAHQPSHWCVLCLTERPTLFVTGKYGESPSYGGKGICRACGPAHEARKARAIGAVMRAKAQGKLPPPRACDCIDCGGVAECYDHRDYDKPLAVDPVCWVCNSLRGPANRRDVSWLRGVLARSHMDGDSASSAGSPLAA